MRFHSATATGADLEAACRSVASAIRQGLGPGPIDLAIVFASPRYGAGIDRLPVLLHELLSARTQIGCTGAALIGDGHLLANRHGITVLAGRLPGVELHAMAIANGDLPDPDAPPSAWRSLLPIHHEDVRGMLVLTEPFHGDATALLAGLDYGWPNAPKVGGVASGSNHPDGNVVFVGRTVHRTGAVLLAMAGDVTLQAVMSQGCRPIGRSGRITKAERNRLVAIDDSPARMFVEEQLMALADQDLDLAERSPLFLGIDVNPFAATATARSNYLVRNILGIDPDSGNVLVSDHLAVGRRIQLHLRDAATSQHDLHTRLAATHPHTAQAALLFRCLGREGADHDTFAALANGVPLVGFHCNGEIGPVGGSTHLQGYTAAFGLLRRRPQPPIDLPPNELP
ncbi:MAG: FIST C-terminal domain-containing protein [Planctomycetes bacterium]|jgi:small ligand-binding sensory domain FIST|nr:FIST C-terminal domain-containing protein [Planctomycetota bacterium]